MKSEHILNKSGRLPVPIDEICLKWEKYFIEMSEDDDMEDVGIGTKEVEVRSVE